MCKTDRRLTCRQFQCRLRSCPRHLLAESLLLSQLQGKQDTGAEDRSQVIINFLNYGLVIVASEYSCVSE